MFKNMAADVLGLSDIGSVIKPADYDKVDADDYVLHEDGEKIYFLIKSKTDEYCFTDLALIHLDGTSAVSKRRMLHRYPYSYYHFDDVRLETAGTVDLDIEIKFKLGGQSYSIDVAKSFLPDLKKLYKALLKVASLQKSNARHYSHTQTSLSTAQAILNQVTRTPANLDEQFKNINQYVFEWLERSHKSYTRQNFGEIFAHYIGEV
ncbi:MAG: PH domain-containing protein [Prochlorothrix sp.]